MRHGKQIYSVNMSMATWAQDEVPAQHWGACCCALGSLACVCITTKVCRCVMPEKKKKNASGTNKPWLLAPSVPASLPSPSWFKRDNKPAACPFKYPPRALAAITVHHRHRYTVRGLRQAAASDVSCLCAVGFFCGAKRRNQQKDGEGKKS